MSQSQLSVKYASKRVSDELEESTVNSLTHQK